MANWCSNAVVFDGNPQAIEQVQQLFKTMAEKEEKEYCGQLPEFLENINDGYFFDIYIHDDTTAVFRYETRWSPNTDIVKRIAEHYDVDFVHDYEECGNSIYGRAIYTDKMLTDVHLNYEDFGRYEYDEDTLICTFETVEYESNSEILEIILERKVAEILTNSKI